MAVFLLASVGSCERKNPADPADPSPEVPNQGVAEIPKDNPRPSEGEKPKPAPEDPSEGPVLIEKKPPVAEPVPGQPGFVISPYNGKVIDVKGIPAGSLVADPNYPAAEKKHFRVPEMPEVPVEPPKLLDPSVLINPGGAKEKVEPEPKPRPEQP